MRKTSRIRHILAANVSHLLDRVEDPVKMLTALLREMDEAHVEASRAMKSLEEELQTTQSDMARDREHVDRLRQEAEEAIAEGNEEHAREKISARMDLERELATKQTSINAVREALTALGQDIEKLAERRATAMHRLSSSREQKHEQQQKARYATQAHARIKATDETLDRLEARIDRMHAQAESLGLGASSPAADSAIDDELDRLKQRIA